MAESSSARDQQHQQQCVFPMSENGSRREVRKEAAAPPSGLQRLKWLGPGVLWMISSVGSGSVLFTPRVGAQYGYTFLWAAILVCFLMWIMIHEIGRYTVVTGRTILDGYNDLPGPRGWAIWFIFLPQIVAAVVTIAGIGALAGSALMEAFPGPQWAYAAGSIIAGIVLVVTGRYKRIERATNLLAGVLVLIVVVTAWKVFPSNASGLKQGLVPGVPDHLDIYFVLPWIGFILAGAAGIMWYSYWVAARGFGGPNVGEEASEGAAATEPGDSVPPEKLATLKSWSNTMGATAALGVMGGGLVIISFLILGTELLKPEGLVPEGIRVAQDLSKLLSEVWGNWGKWALIAGVFIALWGTIVADQDGWGRMFADATLLLLKGAGDGGRRFLQTLDRANARLPKRQSRREFLRDAYAVIIVALLPLIVFFLVRKPVDILSVAGVVAAAHTPVVVYLTLYLNRTRLPKALRPGWFTTGWMVFAGLFYGGFALLHLLDLIGIQLL